MVDVHHGDGVALAQRAQALLERAAPRQAGELVAEREVMRLLQERDHEDHAAGRHEGGKHARRIAPFRGDEERGESAGVPDLQRRVLGPGAPHRRGEAGGEEEPREERRRRRAQRPGLERPLQRQAGEPVEEPRLGAEQREPDVGHAVARPLLGPHHGEQRVERHQQRDRGVDELRGIGQVRGEGEQHREGKHEAAAAVEPPGEHHRAHQRAAGPRDAQAHQRVGQTRADREDECGGRKDRGREPGWAKRL